MVIAILINPGLWGHAGNQEQKSKSKELQTTRKADCWTFYLIYEFNLILTFKFIILREFIEKWEAKNQAEYLKGPQMVISRT